MKFGNLLKKELRELITPQALASMAAMLVLFIFLAFLGFNGFIITL